MKRDLVIDRPKGEGPRATGSIPDGLRRSWYRAQLEQELGITPEDMRRRRAQAGPDDDDSLLLHPISIVLIAILFFAAVLGVLLWQSGDIQRFVAAHNPHHISVPRKWQLGSQRAEPVPAGSSPAGQTTAEPAGLQAYAGIDDAPPARVVPAQVVSSESDGESGDD
jgi:hypothetical protein